MYSFVSNSKRNWNRIPFGYHTVSLQATPTGSYQFLACIADFTASGFEDPGDFHASLSLSNGMSSRIVDIGGFTSPVPNGIDESDPANDPLAPDETAAADAAAVIAAEDKAQAKKEREEEETDAIAPLSGDVPTIPRPPACKNLDQLMSSLPPLPKLEDITPETHGGCT